MKFSPGYCRISQIKLRVKSTKKSEEKYSQASKNFVFYQRKLGIVRWLIRLYSFAQQFSNYFFSFLGFAELFSTDVSDCLDSNGYCAGESQSTKPRGRTGPYTAVSGVTRISIHRLLCPLNLW